MVAKIAFGTTLLDKGLNDSGIDGIGQYCQELLGEYQRQCNDLTISPFSFGVNTSPSHATLLPSYSGYLTKSLLNLPINDFSRNYFEGADLIHATDQLIPIVRNKPLVATVMDAIPLSHPQYIKARSRIIKPYLWKKLTQRANHIITISEFSKNEISYFMEYRPELISSIPLGVDDRYFERLPNSQRQKVLEQFDISRPFFFFVGSIQPRKNLLRTLQAHASLPNSLPQEFPIIIAGKLAWDDGLTLQAIHKGIEEKRCIWLRYISEEQKRGLLQECLGMIFASLYEGFGLPILEAFASNTPVITSNCTSMPEVAGKAGIYVDPYDQDSIRDALLSLIEDKYNLPQLKADGLTRAKLFSWSKAAAKTIDIYKSLI